MYNCFRWKISRANWKNLKCKSIHIDDLFSLRNILVNYEWNLRFFCSAFDHCWTKFHSFRGKLIFAPTRVQWMQLYSLYPIIMAPKKYCRERTNKQVFQALNYQALKLSWKLFPSEIASPKKKLHENWLFKIFFVLFHFYLTMHPTIYLILILFKFVISSLDGYYDDQNKNQPRI